MAKMAVVSIGYHDYAMSMNDAMTIMKIAEKAKEVRYEAGRNTFVHTETDNVLASEVRLATVEKRTAPKIIPKSHRITDESRKPNLLNDL
ncbi:hypothetical protein OQ496_09325 [Acetobacter suratthaniensis]|uniref:GGDEF domain-containing protein n=1 Tax=Acetobacter suratthaniensis TaxID=1502841 RepID=A0ABS3LME1_9PROT|nr:hypothetical protein [Acetobacter suratthaniensis]MBO1328530.1 hypothetical protein [Acetobacter suratthaniensis]MCX2566659.1 hypothetical protein [Acetobacter suratthaniensis]